MRSVLLPTFNKAFFYESHATTFVTRGGLSRSYNQAAQVPSSNVTHKLPRSPSINCKMVAAFVSRMDSLTSLPSLPADPSPRLRRSLMHVLANIIVAAHTRSFRQVMLVAPPFLPGSALYNA